MIDGGDEVFDLGSKYFPNRRYMKRVGRSIYQSPRRSTNRNCQMLSVNTSNVAKRMTSGHGGKYCG